MALFYMKIKQYNLTQIIFVKEKGEHEKRKESVLYTCHHAQLSRTGMFPEELITRRQL